jgi:hypothetical protein
MATTTVGDEFLAVLCADDEFVRAEFDAIIANAWDTPAEPAPEPPRVPPVRPDLRSAHAPRSEAVVTDAAARQRSPPRRAGRSDPVPPGSNHR